MPANRKVYIVVISRNIAVTIVTTTTATNLLLFLLLLVYNMPKPIKITTFVKGKDPVSGLKLYEVITECNNWTNRQKLSSICNCLPDDYVEWAIEVVSDEKTA